MSSENAKLRGDLEKLAQNEEEKDNNKDQEMVKVLRRNKTRISYRKDERGSEWEGHKDTDLFGIFSAIAPALISEATSKTIRQELAFKYFNYEAHNNYPVPKNYVDHWINDLTCLGLISPSQKKHSVHDDNEYWVLSDLGFRVHSSLRRLQLELGTEIDESEEPEDDESYQTS